MSATIPAEARDLVESDVPAVVSYRDDAGRIVSWPFWAEVVDGRVVLSADRASRKAAHLRPTRRSGSSSTTATTRSAISPPAAGWSRSGTIRTRR